MVLVVRAGGCCADADRWVHGVRLMGEGCGGGGGCMVVRWLGAREQGRGGGWGVGGRQVAGGGGRGAGGGWW